MKQNWNIDFKNFTINIHGDITAKDFGQMINQMVNHERNVVEDWHSTYQKWKVVTNVSVKLENDDTERPSNESI